MPWSLLTQSRYYSLTYPMTLLIAEEISPITAQVGSTLTPDRDCIAPVGMDQEPSDLYARPPDQLGLTVVTLRYRFPRYASREVQPTCGHSR